MTEFQPIWDAAIRSFHDFFLENRNKKTIKVSKRMADIYLKGLQKSQQQEATVAEGKYIFYSIVGKRFIEVM